MGVHFYTKESCPARFSPQNNIMLENAEFETNMYLAKCIKVEFKVEISVDLASSEQAPTDTAPRNGNLRV